jgi:hypothetical protein
MAVSRPLTVLRQVKTPVTFFRSAITWAAVMEPRVMSKSRKKRAPKRVFALPDLEQAKSVPQYHQIRGRERTHDHAIPIA